MDDGTTCAIRQANPEPLTVDGHEFYVEPDALVASEGELLLAGSPTYLWTRAPRQHRIHLARDSLLGIVLDTAGNSHGIRWPLEGRPLAGIRATPLEDGNWGIAFAEQDSLDTAAWNSARRLWYGIFDGTRWISLERVPLPPGWRSLPLTSSSLVRGPDTLAWAIIVEASQGPPPRGRVGLLRRADGAERWSFEHWPFGASYVDLAYSNSLGFVAAVVRPDTARPPPSRDSNSLFLYYPASDSQRELRKIVPGDREPVHRPRLHLDSSSTLSWSATVREPGGMRQEARALTNPLGSRGSGPIILDSDAATVLHVPTEERHLWVTEHLLPTESSARELRITGLSADGANRLGRLPNPFQPGPGAAVARGRQDLLVVGPDVITTPDTLVRTLVLQVRLEPCQLPAGGNLSGRVRSWSDAPMDRRRGDVM